MMKPGKPRTSETTIQNLEKQIDIAVKGVKKPYFEAQTTSGSRDEIVEEITDILFELNQVLSGKVPHHPRTPIRKMKRPAIRKELQAQADALKASPWHNALLSINEFCEFEVHAQSPIEVLHTLWLGIVKYLANATSKFIDADLLRTRLEGVSTAGLDCGRVFPAKNTLRFVNSLHGKEYKMLAQAMPTALAPLVDDGQAPQRLQIAWTAVGRLARAISHAEIVRADIDAHIIKKFGPSTNFNTERFESFNAPIREASCHSNRHSPSFDILTRLQDHELLRHVISGGEWIREGRIVKASSRIQDFVNDPEHSILMETWGLQPVKKRGRPGQVTTASRTRPNKIFQNDQLRAQVIGDFPGLEDEECEQGNKVWSQAWDPCEGMIAKIRSITKRCEGVGLVQVELLQNQGWSEEWQMDVLLASGSCIIIPATPGYTNTSVNAAAKQLEREIKKARKASQRKSRKKKTQGGGKEEGQEDFESRAGNEDDEEGNEEDWDDEDENEIGDPNEEEMDMSSDD
ncbi:hypothetical protein OC842_000452 [Tilletia horrida]|uniref:Uncharacterized protein n=1 Tax=Tilletia horrida TaxID=155126 RepID=A0AAN6GJF5_9BASI|nr:hypothetical protein OC842_000452 [Tilletia horrida]